MWVEALADRGYETAKMAVTNLTKSADWWPTIAEFGRTCDEVSQRRRTIPPERQLPESTGPRTTRAQAVENLGRLQDVLAQSPIKRAP